MKEANLKEVLDALLERLDCGPKSGAASVYNRWATIVGDDLVDKVQLQEIKHNRLIISCTHSAWASTLMMRKKQVLENVNRLYPELEIKQIQIRVKGNS